MQHVAAIAAMAESLIGASVAAEKSTVPSENCRMRRRPNRLIVQLYVGMQLIVRQHPVRIDEFGNVAPAPFSVTCAAAGRRCRAGRRWRGIA